MPKEAKSWAGTETSSQPRTAVPGASQTARDSCESRQREHSREPMKPAHPVTATGPSAAVTGAIAVSRLGGSLQQQQQQQRSAGVRYRLPCRGARTSATSSSAAACMARLHRGFIYTPSSTIIISFPAMKKKPRPPAWRRRARTPSIDFRGWALGRTAAEGSWQPCCWHWLGAPASCTPPGWTVSVLGLHPGHRAAVR